MKTVKISLMLILFLFLSGCISERTKVINLSSSNELEGNVGNGIVGMKVTPIEEIVKSDLLVEELAYKTYTSESLVRLYVAYKIKEDDIVLLAVPRKELFSEPMRLELNRKVILFGVLEKDTKKKFFVLKVRNIIEE